MEDMANNVGFCLNRAKLIFNNQKGLFDDAPKI